MLSGNCSIKLAKELVSAQVFSINFSQSSWERISGQAKLNLSCAFNGSPCNTFNTPFTVKVLLEAGHSLFFKPRKPMLNFWFNYAQLFFFYNCDFHFTSIKYTPVLNQLEVYDLMQLGILSNKPGNAADWKTNVQDNHPKPTDGCAARRNAAMLLMPKITTTCPNFAKPSCLLAFLQSVSIWLFKCQLKCMCQSS